MYVPLSSSVSYLPYLPDDKLPTRAAEYVEYLGHQNLYHSRKMG